MQSRHLLAYYEAFITVQFFQAGTKRVASTSTSTSYRQSNPACSACHAAMATGKMMCRVKCEVS